MCLRRGRIFPEPCGQRKPTGRIARFRRLVHRRWMYVVRRTSSASNSGIFATGWKPSYKVETQNRTLGTENQRPVKRRFVEVVLAPANEGECGQRLSGVRNGDGERDGQVETATRRGLGRRQTSFDAALGGAGVSGAGRATDRPIARTLPCRVGCLRCATRGAIGLGPAEDRLRRTAPIAAHRKTIVDALRDHQVLIVCGETGSGNRRSCR